MLYFKFISINFILFAFFKYAQAALWFPGNSAYGIFAAIAVPLDLPHRNVFISYNFEANYNLPKTWDIPPYATGIEEEDLFDEQARLQGDHVCTNCTSTETEADTETETETEADEEQQETEESIEAIGTINATKNDTESNDSRRKRRKRARIIPSLLTRKHFYHILIDKFKRSGFEGEPCLLRLICEMNASELGFINGVLGNIMHIIFSPSTSRNENLDLKYYQAEVDGIHDQCHYYDEICPESILDLISTPLYKIIDGLLVGK